MRRRRRDPAGTAPDPAGDPSGASAVPASPFTASNPLDDPEFVSGLRPVPSGIGDAPVAWPATDVSGVGPGGMPVRVDLGTAVRPVLLVFLSTNCDGCELFWQGLRDDPLAGADVAVVTKGPAIVSPDEVAGRAAGITVPIVMTDTAWVDFRVTSYPFLVLVAPHTSRILGESVGFGWSDAAALIDAGVGR